MSMKKLKKMLLMTLSCMMISVPVLAAEVPGHHLTVESEENSHLKISKSRVHSDYATGEYKKVTLLPSVVQVEQGCFADHLYLEEIEWMASTDTIPFCAFYTCPKLKKVTISDNVKDIDNLAFKSDIALTSVKLPKNLKRIGPGAFANCRSLKKLYIPESVADIGMAAFESCDSLTVYGKKNSYAYYYCKMNNVPFVSQGTASKPATDRPYIKSTESKVVDKQIYSTIALNGKVKDADGYQYQICENGKVLANKNSKNTSYTFKKAPEDVYGYARARAYKIKNGKKIYSEWSNNMRLVSAGVKRDNIKLVKVTGGKRTVKAQFSKLKFSEGFDCVLKNAATGENIILKKQKKNIVTFKNVKPGTYNLIAHAYSMLNGKKQFGAWSSSWAEAKKVVVR